MVAKTRKKAKAGYMISAVAEIYKLHEWNSLQLSDLLNGPLVGYVNFTSWVMLTRLLRRAWSTEFRVA